MVLRFGHLRALIVSATMAFGCSQGSDIQLRGPRGPVSTVQVPGQEPTGPSTPANTGDTTSAPKDPAKQPPLPVRYRVLCDDRYPPYNIAISSLASPTGFGAGIEIGELDKAGKFDPLITRNLEYHENLQIVSLPKFGEARVLFAAKRMSTNPSYAGQSRFIFVSDLDLTARGGIAKFIANEVPVDSRTASFAREESLSVRTFGVSDGGRYLLIGQGDGYRLVDSKTLLTLGTLKVGGADLNINPSLRESDMVFSVATSNGTSFSSKLYSLGLNPNGTVKSLTEVSTVNLLRRPLVPIQATANDSFAALDTSNRIVVVSPLKPRAVTQSRIARLPLKGRLASSIAFWREPSTGGLRAVIVFENFVADSSGGITHHYKIEQAFVRALEIDETKLLADALTNDYDYPPESKQAVEMGIGTGRYPGVTDLRAASDGAAIFGLFPGSLSSQLYRMTSSGLVRVSQDACRNFSIGREL